MDIINELSWKIEEVLNRLRDVFVDLDEIGQTYIALNNYTAIDEVENIRILLNVLCINAKKASEKYSDLRENMREIDFD